MSPSYGLGPSSYTLYKLRAASRLLKRDAAVARYRALLVAPCGHACSRRSAVLGVPAVTALVLLALTGCGSSDNGVSSKSGQEILAATKAAAKSARSVHVVGRNSQGRLSLLFDLRLAGNGSRGRVSFLRLNYEVIRIGGTVYIKGGPAFYKRLGVSLGRTNLDVPKGTWLHASATSGPLAQIAAFTDLQGELGRILSTPGSVTKGASTTVKGQKAIALKEKTKVYEGSLYVASTGKPYPIELVKSGGRERGRTTFSEWDEGVSLSAPSPSIDVSTLTH